MRHAAAVYLGCAGLLIGGTGLTYEKLAARNPAPTATNTAANDTALFVQASLAAAPTPADWPPQNAAVAHLDEWTSLVAPPPRQAAAQPQPPVDDPYAARASRDPQVQTRTSRRGTETIREVPRDAWQDRRRGATRYDRRRGPPPRDDQAQDDPGPDQPRTYRVEREDDRSGDDRTGSVRTRDRRGRDAEVRVWRDRGRNWGNREADERSPRAERPASAPESFPLFGPLFER